MKLKSGVRKALNLILVYVVAGIVIFAMSERIERLNEIERLENETKVAININK